MFITNGAFIAKNSPPYNYYPHYHHDSTTINTHTLLKPSLPPSNIINIKNHETYQHSLISHRPLHPQSTHKPISDDKIPFINIHTPSLPSMEEISSTLTQLMQSQQSFQASVSASINNLTFEFHDLQSRIPPLGFTSPFTLSPQHHPQKPLDLLPDRTSAAEERKEIEHCGSQRISPPKFSTSSPAGCASMRSAKEFSILEDFTTDPEIVVSDKVKSSDLHPVTFPTLTMYSASSRHLPNQFRIEHALLLHDSYFISLLTTDLVNRSSIVTTRPFPPPYWFTAARGHDDDSQAKVIEIQIKVDLCIGNNFICSFDLVDVGPLIIDPGGLLKIACTVATTEVSSLDFGSKNNPVFQLLPPTPSPPPKPPDSPPKSPPLLVPANSSKPHLFRLRSRPPPRPPYMLLRRDSVTWNLMISEFGKAGLYSDVVHYFRQMLKHQNGIELDYMTLPSILSACVKEGDLLKVKEVHGFTVRNFDFDAHAPIGNEMIDNYGKRGRLKDSENDFKTMCCANLLTWTTTISCYGMHGKREESVFLFKKMINEGFRPNAITLTAILDSCSHSGLLGQGKKIYGIEPTAEHYTCMHKNVEIGDIAAHHLFQLEPNNTSNYVAL